MAEIKREFKLLFCVIFLSHVIVLAESVFFLLESHRELDIDRNTKLDGIETESPENLLFLYSLC